MTRRRHVLGGTLGLLTGLAGCGSRSDAGERTDAGPSPPAATATPPDHRQRTPHLQPSGNRVIAGSGALPSAEPVDITLGQPAEPAWVVALPAGDASDWVVADRGGDLVGRRVGPKGVRSVPVEPATLPSGQPPTLARVDGRLVVPGGAPEPAGGSHPLALGDGRVVVDDGGALVVDSPGARQRFDIDAPPDAYPVRAGSHVVVLAAATDRYGHGALGDGIEAGGFAVVDLAGSGGPELTTRVSTPGDAVVEGAPILADLTGDGKPEVIVTETDAERGARLVAYSLAGERVARGPAIGSGYRWRHQLAVAPFARDGLELAVVRTPHIGGTAEFYRRDGDRLRIVARADSVSSHALGSRNLDGAVATDADSAGSLELVVPNDARRRLVGVRRTDDGATLNWRAPVGGRIASNLHAVPVGGRVVFGVAREDGVLRVWP
jgi:hypothetical protein